MLPYFPNFLFFSSKNLSYNFPLSYIYGRMLLAGNLVDNDSSFCNPTAPLCPLIMASTAAPCCEFAFTFFKNLANRFIILSSLRQLLSLSQKASPMLSGSSTPTNLVAARSVWSFWCSGALRRWGRRPHLTATTGLLWQRRTGSFWGQMAGHLGQVARASLVGIARVYLGAGMRVILGKGVDSLGAESGVNLEFGQGMDGWTFVSFCAELPRILICK